MFSPCTCPADLGARRDGVVGGRAPDHRRRPCLRQCANSRAAATARSRSCGRCGRNPPARACRRRLLPARRAARKTRNACDQAMPLWPISAVAGPPSCCQARSARCAEALKLALVLRHGVGDDQHQPARRRRAVSGARIAPAPPAARISRNECQNRRAHHAVQAFRLGFDARPRPARTRNSRCRIRRSRKSCRSRPCGRGRPARSS